MIRLPVFLLLSPFVILFIVSGVISTNFTITNNCNYTIWPALVSGNGGQELSDTGFILQKGKSITINAAPWSGHFGRVWARTQCTSGSTGKFECVTGDCQSGKIECAGGTFTNPVTLGEFSFSNGQDLYDVSLVNGYNLQMSVVPQGGVGGNCSVAGCNSDLNKICPSELKILSNGSVVVGCKSACDAFAKSAYCCTGANQDMCEPSKYSRLFKQACPRAYSYPRDKDNVNFACGSVNYVINFCPSPAYSIPSSPPSPSLLVEPPPPQPRTASTNTTKTTTNRKKKSKLHVYVVVSSVMAVLVTIAIWCFYLRRKQAKNKFHDNEIKNAESLQFKFSTISAATNDFSEANKLGEGGFGPVYKGIHSNGQEIAVKRLSKHSDQGEGEFKNDVILLTKLEHRNLVRLLGFCLEKEEKLLIYEFMPNASLDQFIFDPIKSKCLNWEKRYKIIGGIARGLLYLHEESRLKIVHRDLKANNILLDANMNPKISDFGMARLFVVDQTQANTSRIVGTYGYMAPEYVKHGQFSVKSDVFSFGVLVLEIISGKKNTSFYESEVANDLLSYAWINLKNGKGFELVDENLRDNCSKIEVMRCLHIGMLCVQENISDRPSMASVILMLNSYSTTLPFVSSPAFFSNSINQPTIDLREGDEEEVVLLESSTWSLNEASFTDPYPR